jgi:small subunit ribosomal protein S21
VQVLVRDNNIDQALRALKKKMQREGLFREMKLHDHYEKPSERKTREKAEAIRRAPQGRTQENAARGSAADEAQGNPRGPRKRRRSCAWPRVVSSK